jgi:hypothetical protein
LSEDFPILCLGEPTSYGMARALTIDDERDVAHVTRLLLKHVL